MFFADLPWHWLAYHGAILSRALKTSYPLKVNFVEAKHDRFEAHADPGADWCLEPGVVTNLGLQAPGDLTVAQSKVVELKAEVQALKTRLDDAAVGRCRSMMSTRICGSDPNFWITNPSDARDKAGKNCKPVDGGLYLPDAGDATGYQTFPILFPGLGRHLFSLSGF